MGKKSYDAAMGASHPAGTAQITFFVPSKDRVGQAIDQELWANEALACFGTLFRGATAFPPGKGVWRNDQRGGELIFETTVMIVVYAVPADLDKGASQLRSFLHRFGREANQGEVGIVINGLYCGISEYDDTDSANGATDRTD
jgi:hypothetical protein